MIKKILTNLLPAFILVEKLVFIVQCTFLAIFYAGFSQNFPCVSDASYLLHVSLTFILVSFLSPFPSSQPLLYFLKKEGKKPRMCQDSPLSNTSGLTSIERALRALATVYSFYTVVETQIYLYFLLFIFLRE